MASQRAEMRGAGPIGDQPGQHQKQAKERDVSVAIRHGLSAHLDQPDHRDKTAQEPEPSDGKIPPIARVEDPSSDEHQGEYG
jgi:hypothetical protein